uniref:Uncharacterized protein n=1 Tax=Podoviridae sp. ctza028 TaxID=2825289 RepID=A0A8S5Q450_9CAUD|nr:MAG TPA: hypothetical protein [Podoviridae sp. ctza028]
MNYYKQVAKMLGVELNEEFDVNYMNGYRYQLTEDGLMFKDKLSTTWLGYSSPILSKLLRGDYSIVKLPWRPKNGEHYYVYSTYHKTVLETNWQGVTEDLLYWNIGNCFRTREEARKKGKEIMEKIEKEYRES